MTFAGLVLSGLVFGASCMAGALLVVVLVEVIARLSESEGWASLEDAFRFIGETLLRAVRR